jgi:peptidoglycan/xylan/chitin deacetylase (PgdA/CDA1 family)
MPRAAQLALQRLNARRRLQSVEFPAWPQDATLTRLLGALLAARMKEEGVERVPFVGFWPHGKAWAWCLTHDVELEDGQAQAMPMAAAEEERGVRSSWNFVPERYPVDRDRMEDLRSRGHEIGVHGLEHSGKLFSSRAEFERRSRKINGYVREWGAVGFRSPATYRNPFWLPEIDVDYDSSFMDNATLEPQRGGVCSAYPFMLSERMVELPITLPMDHTLINVLRQDVVGAFASKREWIRRQHGLAVALFHPDYNTSRDAIARYGAVIDGLREAPGGWHALPREIAGWWQRRRRSHVAMRNGMPAVEGPAAADGAVWSAVRDGDGIRIEPAA